MTQSPSLHQGSAFHGLSHLGQMASINVKSNLCSFDREKLNSCVLLQYVIPLHLISY